MISQNQSQKNTEKGFTLIEMLVSVGLFSIVLLVVMGSILTIVDVNRKSQSLTVVMNDLNFVLEAMTRTIKTGELDSLDSRSYNPIGIVDQDGRIVQYAFEETDNKGRIERTITIPGNPPGDTISLTSSQMDIDKAEFTVFNDPNNLQPRVLVLLKGTVEVGPKISSDFMIQTTVSQRNLDNADLPN
jgi:prepilin-type N-terminal cleavage/methylation domain-containing protein